ncbi:MAG: hydrogenase 4 subunit F, partial [Candidatus Angelobacter sp.]
MVPLAAGPLAFFLRKRRWMEVVNVAAFAILLGLAAVLVAQVLRRGPVAVWNGFFYADAFSALVVLLSTFAALACSVYAVGYFRHEESSGVLQEAEEMGGQFAVGKLREYYTLMPLMTFAMILVVLANNLGILWVAVEGTTLASVFLVMFYGRETSLEAAWKYAIIGGVGLS